MNREVLLGIDIGEHYIGLALNDPATTLVFPLPVLKRESDEETLEKLSQIIEDHKVSKIIIGLPTHHAEGVLKFARKLSQKTVLSIDYVDESLTTQKARDLMLLTKKKKERQKMRDDSLAAAFILEEYLGYTETRSGLLE